MSVSIWQRAAVVSELKCDLVIIGAGIAGLSAALEGQRLGMHVEILESREVGEGTSGRNAGYLMRGVDENYAAAIQRYGREEAKRLWQLSEQNLVSLRAIGIELVPGYSPVPSCLIAMDDDEACELRESAELLEQDGFDVQLLTKPDDSIMSHPDVRCGLLNPNDAVCDPVAVLRWLAAKLDRPVRERQRVGAVEHVRQGVLVKTPEFDVLAGRALFCTNAAVQAPGMVSSQASEVLRRLIQPNRAQMLSFAVDEAVKPVKRAYYANHGGEYLRRMNDQTVILGGCRRYAEAAERTTDEYPEAPVQGALEQVGARLLGDEVPVVGRWAGTMAFTPDHLPISMSLDDGVCWYCGGFSGQGMSLGFQTARMTVQAMMEGGSSPFPVDRPTLAGTSV